MRELEYLAEAVLALPAVGIAATAGVYLAALRLNRRCHGHPLANPTLISILVLAIALRILGVDYACYERSAATVSFFLAPAVTLLAVPLFRQRQLIKQAWLPITGALAIAMPTGAASGMTIAWLLGADRQTLLSLAPKSSSTGIAMGLAEKIGGLPALTAVLVIMTGITGAVLAPGVAKLLRSEDSRAIGLALGMTSHGIGSARAFQMCEVMGAFAGLGMALNGVATGLLLPGFLAWLGV